MATLKYKDENGVWRYVPSLKYKDGNGVYQNKGTMKYKNANGVWQNVRICRPESEPSAHGEYPTISTLTVGSSVYLNENGSPVEYLIVHTGLPDATLYDSSCDGVWLLRKDLLKKRTWGGNNNDYQNSDVHTYLNSDIMSSFDVQVQNIIKQVKIPYINGNGSSWSLGSLANGLSAKIFLPSLFEIGLTAGTSNEHDGVCLNYFDDNSKRIAYLNGAVTTWWLRSPIRGVSSTVYIVSTTGGVGTSGCSSSHGIRPCMILPHTATLDPETNIIIG